MPLTDLLQTYNALKSFNFEDEQEVIVRDNSEVIADLQAEQWAQGLTSQGLQINPPYSPYTISKKAGKPGLSGVTSYVTFYDTGELYRLLRAVVTKGEYTITADTFKFKKVVDRSGQRIIGLMEDNQTRFRESVTLPALKKVFKQKTWLEIT